MFDRSGAKRRNSLRKGDVTPVVPSSLEGSGMQRSTRRSTVLAVAGVLLLAACQTTGTPTQRPSVAGQTQGAGPTRAATQAAPTQAASPQASPLEPAAQVECPEAPAAGQASPQPSGQNEKSFW